MKTIPTIAESTIDTINLDLRNNLDNAAAIANIAAMAARDAEALGSAIADTIHKTVAGAVFSAVYNHMAAEALVKHATAAQQIIEAMP